MHVLGFSHRCRWGVRSSRSGGPKRLLALEGEGTPKRLEPLNSWHRVIYQKTWLVGPLSWQHWDCTSPLSVCLMSWIFDRNTWNGIYRNFEHNLVTGRFLGWGSLKSDLRWGFWKVILSPTPTACYAYSTHVPVWVETTPIARRTPTQSSASPRTTVWRGGKKRCGDTAVLGRSDPCWHFLVYSLRNEREWERSKSAVGTT